jgi:hypothetical protein
MTAEAATNEPSAAIGTKEYEQCPSPLSLPDCR